jgi:hypothetical protein
MNQIRVLQPRAMFLSLCLRTTENAQAQAKKDGFDGVLFKPFTQEVADELVAHHFETNEVVEVDGNSLRIAEYAGRDDGVPRYYRKLTERLTKQLPTLAEACFDAVEINAAKLRLHREHTLKLLIAVRTEAARLGIGMRVRGPKELGKLMAEVADTSEIPFEVLA